MPCAHYACNDCAEEGCAQKARAGDYGSGRASGNKAANDAAEAVPVAASRDYAKDRAVKGTACGS